MTDRKPDLGAAYALQTPEDSRKLYADWAESYEDDFAESQDYQLHRHVAKAFVASGGQGPALDVGAGTGLCGVELARLGVTPVDATDISAEMLQQAAAKELYRDTIVADLTKDLPFAPESYLGIVSSGTFTTGHVGPDAIEGLLAIARPTCLFAISVNAKHYEHAGFAAKLAQLEPVIYDLRLIDVPIYGCGAAEAHRSDRAFVVLFRKA